MELIKITEQAGQQAVSLRELYTFLEAKAQFTNWAERMFAYGFEEQKDFLPILLESTGGRPQTDYAVTLDMAKEISMIQRTEKGKQARQYFIAVEKKAREAFALERVTHQNQQAITELREEVRLLREAMYAQPPAYLHPPVYVAPRPEPMPKPFPVEAALIARHFKPGGSVRMTATEIKNYLERVSNQPLSLRTVGLQLKRQGFTARIEKHDGRSMQLYFLQ